MHRGLGVLPHERLEDTSELATGDSRMMIGVSVSATCRICGRKLTNSTSVQRGIGPTCWAKLSLKDQMKEAVITGMNHLRKSNGR